MIGVSIAGLLARGLVLLEELFPGLAGDALRRRPRLPTPGRGGLLGICKDPGRPSAAGRNITERATNEAGRRRPCSAPVWLQGHYLTLRIKKELVYNLVKFFHIAVIVRGGHNLSFLD